jgi:serine/threonine protein kinase
MLSLC